MKIILTGATGNAGSGVLDSALASASITHVTVLSRRPLALTHAKLSVIQLTPPDYPDGFASIPDSLVRELKGHTGCIWALGISQSDVSKEDYLKITYDYAMTAATAFKPLGTPAEPFRFIYVSGEGANQSEKSSFLFARVKGRTEKELRALQTESLHVMNVRPGGIVPTPEMASKWGTLHRLRSSTLPSVISSLYPSVTITSRDLGWAALALVRGQAWDRASTQGYIANPELRRIARDFSVAL